jgi:hypothetical protein
VCLLNTDIITETTMSSPSADGGVADAQEANVPNLVEELSQLNSLLRTIVADKGRQEPLPAKTESFVDQPENVLILAEKLKPDPERIYYNYEEVVAFAELLLPTERLLGQLYELFLGCFQIDDVGFHPEFLPSELYPKGESTLQVLAEDNKLVSIPWTQVPRIEDPARRRDVAQKVKSLLPTLNDAWPRERPQRKVGENGKITDTVINWHLSRPGCNLVRSNLVFNGSGYLQTIQASRVIIFRFLTNRILMM